MPDQIYSATIDAPVETVFEGFADFEQAADRVDAIESVEMLTDGPTRMGTQFKETRTMFGRQATETMEVTEFRQNRLITVSADSCGSHFDTRFQFTPQGDKTKVDVEMNIQAQTWIARLMAPIGFLMKGQMTKMMTADFNQIRDWCERQ